jgi:Protein of unknown function (DUF3738)
MRDASRTCPTGQHVLDVDISHTLKASRDYSGARLYAPVGGEFGRSRGDGRLIKSATVLFPPVHREIKEVPVYALTFAKGGPKLKPSTKDDKIRVEHQWRSARTERQTTRRQKSPMANLVTMLGLPGITDKPSFGSYLKASALQCVCVVGGAHWPSGYWNVRSSQAGVPDSPGWSTLPPASSWSSSSPSEGFVTSVRKSMGKTDDELIGLRFDYKRITLSNQSAKPVAPHPSDTRLLDAYIPLHAVTSLNASWARSVSGLFKVLVSGTCIGGVERSCRSREWSTERACKDLYAQRLPSRSSGNGAQMEHGHGGSWRMCFVV